MKNQIYRDKTQRTANAKEHATNRLIQKSFKEYCQVRVRSLEGYLGEKGKQKTFEPF